MSVIACRSITDVIEFAIDREKNALDFYLQCMNRAKNPGVRTFFQEMAEEEASHMKLLMDIDLSANPDFTPAAADDPGLSDYMIDVGFRPEISYQEALVMAMKKEEKAHAFYAAWKDRCGSGHTHRVFTFLAAEEKKHKEKIETLYDGEILQWD